MRRCLSRCVPLAKAGGARRKFSLDIISAKVQIDSNRTSRKASEFPILTLIGTPLSVPRGSSGFGRANGPCVGGHHGQCGQLSRDGLRAPSLGRYVPITSIP